MPTTPNWSRDQKLAALMALPWTVSVEHDSDGSLIARVAEMPDSIATGETEKALARDLWESIEASLSVRLDNDDPFVVPPGITLPWELGKAPPAPPADVIVCELKGPAWERRNPATTDAETLIATAA